MKRKSTIKSLDGFVEICFKNVEKIAQKQDIENMTELHIEGTYMRYYHFDLQ